MYCETKTFGFVGTRGIVDEIVEAIIIIPKYRGVHAFSIGFFSYSAVA